MRFLTGKTLFLTRVLAEKCSQLNPRIEQSDLLRDLSLGSSVTTLTKQRNFLEFLQRNKLATPEIGFLARRIHREVNAPGKGYSPGAWSRIRREEQRILALRIKDAEAEIQRKKRLWTRQSLKISERLPSRLREEYKRIKQAEMQIIWQRNGARLQKKREWCLRKAGLLREAYCEGIPVGDQELEDRFGSWQEEGVILGGIQASSNVKAYLRLPGKYRILEEVNVQEGKVQAEATGARQRHSTAKELREPSGSNEERLQRREKEWEEREPLQGDLVDFTGLKATDLLSNKRIGMLPKIPEGAAIKIETQKMRTTTFLEEFKRQNPVEVNLTKEEMAGQEEILEGIEKHGWWHYNADKSGKQVLDLKENYLDAMLKHVEKDIEVKIEDILAAEDVLNTSSTAFVKMFNLGEPGENQDKIAECLKAKETGAPVAKGQRKDHKVGWDPIIGPKTRRVINGKKGANAGYANVLTRLLRPIRTEAIGEIRTEVASTEELCRSIQDTNERLGLESATPLNTQNRYPKRLNHRDNMQGSTLVVGSMDIESLYGSCKAKGIGQSIRVLAKRSRLNWNVDMRVIVRFLSLTVGSTNSRLDEYIPIAKGTTTLKSFLQCDNGAQFYDPTKHHDEIGLKDKRELIGWAISMGIETLLDNHFYSTGGRYFKQKDGAPEGVDTSVEACDIYMLVWDDKLLKKLKQLGIGWEDYKRYVDDIEMVLKAIEKGWVYNREQDRMIFNQSATQSDGEEDIPPDQYTFKILSQIADTLDPAIKTVFDVPSLHNNGKLPILDLNIWVEGGQIRHQFYKKEIASKYLIHAKSALNNRTKRDTLFQEGLRRLRNTDMSTEPEDIKEMLGHFLNDMRLSGYGYKFRLDVIQGILKRSKEMEEEIRGGTRTRYRNKDQIQTSKEAKLGKYPGTWYLRGEFTSTIKVQASHGSKLAKGIQDITLQERSGDGGYTKVVEMAGKSVILGGGDPFNKGVCPFPVKCAIKDGQDCTKSRLVYEIKCNICDAFYIGTTGHTAHKRGMEHVKALQKGNKEYAMTKHFIEDHPQVNKEDEGLITLSIRDKTRTSNLDRYISEGYIIEDASKTANRGKQVNSRGEWSRISMKRLTVSE